MIGENRVDVAVIGGGFGGSLAAILCARRGLHVALIERGRHPRFAIGESTTPIANLLLEQIARDYELPWLATLSRYGSWKRDLPEIPRGLKRGFAYVHHAAGRAFEPQQDHGSELYVAANAGPERGDTHWLRADFDACLFRQAQQCGVRNFEGANVELRRLDDGWRIGVQTEQERAEFDAGFIIDASGPAGVVAKTIGAAPPSRGPVQTNSRAIYAHFEGIRPWSAVSGLPQSPEAGYPFSSDDATLHHVFDGGWMWVIPFDSGITSTGFCLDATRFPPESKGPAESEWESLLQRFPSIAAQFRDSRRITPLFREDSMQFQQAAFAGDHWAALPTTAGFIDPLFSTGNAHTVLGVLRLVDIVTTRTAGADRSRALGAYSHQLSAEFAAIDRLVHGCYLAMHDMACLKAYAMLYFLAATFCEAEIRRTLAPPSSGFLLAGDAAFQGIVKRFHGEFESAAREGRMGTEFGRSMFAAIGEATRHYNLVGLCDECRGSFYPFTG